MNTLFPKDPITFNLPNAEIVFFPHFFDLSQATLFFEKLLHETPWQADEISVFGKLYPQPRLTAFFGNEGKPYSYSNQIIYPHKWNPLLAFIKNEIEEACQFHFTSVLLNLYRDGKDNTGWHNEKGADQNSVIATVSFGTERFFHLQHQAVKKARQKIPLTHGSLLLMSGTTHHYWKQQTPKTAKPVGPHINLTFRNLR